jgi:hypothetical protein
MELKMEGKWWLPDEQQKLPGTLVFDSDGGTLTVVGAFLPSIGIYETAHKKNFIILGESDERENTQIQKPLWFL